MASAPAVTSTGPVPRPASPPRPSGRCDPSPVAGRHLPRRAGAAITSAGRGASRREACRQGFPRGRRAFAVTTVFACLLGAGPAVSAGSRITIRVPEGRYLLTLGTLTVGSGAIDNYGGLATLLFDTLSGNSGSVTGGSYTRATGTILV